MRVIEIAGKNLEVKFTLRSLKVYEQITGRPLINESYLDICQLTLGVDSLVAFVFCSLHNPEKEITPEWLELNMGIDKTVFSEVVEEYTDFIPGFRAIKEKIKSDPTLVTRLQEAGNDLEKLTKLYAELQESPNVTSQA